jgi:hypothetical protein
MHINAAAARLPGCCILLLLLPPCVRIVIVWPMDPRNDDGLIRPAGRLRHVIQRPAQLIPSFRCGF